MTLNDQIRADAAIFTNPNDFGEAVIWRGDGTGDPVSVNAFVPRAEDFDDGSLVGRQHDGVMIAVADVAEVRQGDTVAIRGHECSVTEREDDGFGMWILTVMVGGPSP